MFSQCFSFVFVRIVSLFQALFALTFSNSFPSACFGASQCMVVGPDTRLAVRSGGITF